jgi:hypothetical protein
MDAMSTPQGIAERRDEILPVTDCIAAMAGRDKI